MGGGLSGVGGGFVSSGGGGSAGSGVGGGSALGGGTSGGTSGTGGGDAGGLSTGGGSTGGGSTAGGSSGGSTGGGASSSGAFFKLDVGFSDPAIMVGADGVLRVAYGFGGAVRYGECQQNCGTLAGWTFVNIDSLNAPGHTRLVRGSDGRLHVLYDAFSISRDFNYYSTCASNCLQASSWTKVELYASIGNSVSLDQGPMVIDSQNRVTFTSGLRAVNDVLRVNTCASNCTVETSWQSGVIRAGAAKVAMVALGTTLHMVYNDQAYRLHYATCASACEQSASWTDSGPLFAQNQTHPTAIAVTAQSSVRIAYNQGVTLATESAAVKAQDDHLLVWECDANCFNATSWSGVVLGIDGANGISIAEYNGAVMLALTNSVELKAQLCTGSCTTAANWLSDVADDTAIMSAALDPYLRYVCSGNRPAFAAWSPNNAKVALTPNGEAFFVHAARGLRRCMVGGNAEDLPAVGRFILYQ